jgi:hypothetical protein
VREEAVLPAETAAERTSARMKASRLPRIPRAEEENSDKNYIKG